MEINRDELKKVAKEEFPELQEAEIESLVDEFVNSKLPQLKQSI